MEFINTHKRKFFAAIAVLLVVIGILTGMNRVDPIFLKNTLGFVVVPVQNVVSYISGAVGSQFGKTRDAQLLAEENAELKERVAVLTDEINRLSVYEKENIELSKLLDINRKYPNYEKMGVQIISADTSNWYNVFTIDRGSDDGLEEDMFVVADGGLAGRIFEVSSNYSKVMAIIDDRSAVHGQTKQTDDIGVVKGDSYLMRQGMCVMEHITLDADINVNDEIVTSVYSEYPAGITIGFVKAVNPSADGLTKSAIISPGVDFKGLKKAIVLLRRIED